MVSLKVQLFQHVDERVWKKIATNHTVYTYVRYGLGGAIVNNSLINAIEEEVYHATLSETNSNTYE